MKLSTLIFALLFCIVATEIHFSQSKYYAYNLSTPFKLTDEPNPNPYKVKQENEQYRLQLKIDKIKSVKHYSIETWLKLPLLWDVANYDLNGNLTDSVSVTGFGSFEIENVSFANLVSDYDKKGCLIDSILSLNGNFAFMKFKNGNLINELSASYYEFYPFVLTNTTYKYTGDILTKSYLTKNDYDFDGKELHIKKLPNSLVWNYSFYPNGLLSQIIITDTLSKEILKKYYCNYDSLGNWTLEIDSVENANDITGAILHRIYQYDDANRLKSFTFYSWFNSGKKEITYIYDKEGLLKEEILEDPNVKTKYPLERTIYTYNSNKQLKNKDNFDKNNQYYTKIQYEYDSKGKLIYEKTLLKDGSNTFYSYFYDNKGYLIRQVKTVDGDEKKKKSNYREDLYVYDYFN